MEVVSLEVATKEVNDWVTSRRKSKAFRELEVIPPVIQNLIESVCQGDLIINDDNSITQKLKFPLAGGVTTEIKYSSRFTVGAFHKKLKQISDTDYMGRNIAKLVILSGQPNGVIEALDGIDYDIASAIAVFF